MKPIQFTRQDTLHAVLGVIPAVLLVASGHLTPGVAFAIGLLPTSLLGIAPTRRLRAVYGLLGCLFGAGVYAGSHIVSVHSTWAAAAILMAVAFAATVVAASRPAGGLLLSLLVPSLGVGTGYLVSEASGLAVAFVLGSLWSSAVAMLWSEFQPSSKTRDALQALQPANPRLYGLLLGLTAATALVVGARIDPAHAGWVATAALLVMRPVHEMAGLRGLGRAASTIAGTLVVAAAIQLGLGYAATAVLVGLIAILTIGARSSRWYVTSFGTAYLILTIELYGAAGTSAVHEVAWYRIIDNVVGALIALFFGLAMPELVHRVRARPTRRDKTPA